MLHSGRCFIQDFTVWDSEGLPFLVCIYLYSCYSWVFFFLNTIQYLILCALLFGLHWILWNCSYRQYVSCRVGEKKSTWVLWSNRHWAISPGPKVWCCPLWAGPHVSINIIKAILHRHFRGLYLRWFYTVSSWQLKLIITFSADGGRPPDPKFGG